MSRARRGSALRAAGGRTAAEEHPLLSSPRIFPRVAPAGETGARNRAIGEGMSANICRDIATLAIWTGCSKRTDDVRPEPPTQLRQQSVGRLRKEPSTCLRLCGALRIGRPPLRRTRYHRMSSEVGTPHGDRWLESIFLHRRLIQTRLQRHMDAGDGQLGKPGNVGGKQMKIRRREILYCAYPRSIQLALRRLAGA